MKSTRDSSHRSAKAILGAVALDLNPPLPNFSSMKCDDFRRGVSKGGIRCPSTIDQEAIHPFIHPEDIHQFATTLAARFSVETRPCAKAELHQPTTRHRHSGRNHYNEQCPIHGPWRNGLLVLEAQGF